jgi:hypothetical protein
MSEEGAFRRCLRRFTLGHGPLKRRSDRLEFLSRTVVALVVLLAVPVALAVGTASLTTLREVAVHEAATRHEATAVLLEGVRPTHTEGRSQAVRASWDGPDGLPREGRVPVPPGADAGAGKTVTVWVDDDGSLSRKPLTQEQAAGGAVFNAIMTFVGMAAVAAGGHLLVVFLLGRHRGRQWEAEWAVVEPRWAGRLR